MPQSLLLLLTLFLIPFTLQSQNPVVLNEDLSIRAVAESPFESTRLSYNQKDETLYLLTRYGQIFSVDVESGSLIELQNNSDHGLADVQGMDISGNGEFFIVGNIRDGANYTNTGIIKKGEINDGVWEWVTVAETESYPLSNTFFDHIMNGIVVSPDNKYLYVNSGSRTDHGEVHSVDGRFPNMREAPLTAIILRIPADGTDLYLENDIEFLENNGYLFADGVRNSFSLAFNAEGHLFATENAGERDDPDELNWLREGHHYGFPWKMGGNLNPMQFEGYMPEEDNLLPTASGSYHFFYDDPDFPDQPEGITFTEPIRNYGPDAVNYRNPDTGEIFNASESDTSITSFTGHRSPLGLVFDTPNTLDGDYTGDAFVLSFSGEDNNAYLLRFMDDPGEDLLHIKLAKTDNGYKMTSTTIANGFISPVDSELIGNKLYVVEHKNPQWLNSNASTRIWEIEFPGIGTSIDESVDEIAQKFTLHQNYPNPFNPSTRISYSLSVPGNVHLAVYDALGRKVRTLVEGYQNTGSHTISFNAGDIPSGLYFYRLQMTSENGPSKIRKMILLK